MASTFWMSGPNPHETDGLPGYLARDYGAPPGTGVYAWAPMQVTRISGGPGVRGKGIGGYNVYLKDRSGRQFFMTHINQPLVRVGQVLRPGQEISTVANLQGITPHVHIGYQGGDPSAVLGLKPDYVFSAQGAATGSIAVNQSIGRQSTQQQGGYKGPLADVPVLGAAGRGATRGLDWLLHPVDQAIGVAKAPFNAIQWVTGNWDRVLEVVGGFILVLVGLILLGRSVGMSTPKGGRLTSRTSDPLEDAFSAGEAQGMASAARSAGREQGRASYRRSRPSSQGATTASGDDIPY